MTQYKPITTQEAATLLGVNIDTFKRKFLEKTGIRISELPQGKISFEQFMVIGTHFAKNYPSAADAIGRFSSDADGMSGRHADDKRMKSDGSGRQSDDMRTANGRTDEISGRQADERTQADEIGRLLKQIHNQQVTLKEAQNRIVELERTTQLAEATSRRQADEIGRLKQNLADERTEIERIKRLLADEKTSGRADEIEKQFTIRLEKAKVEWEKQERIRRADERTKSDEALFALRFQVSQKEDDLKIVRAELNRYKEISKGFTFEIKSLWRQELDTINIVSNILAAYGFTLVFGFVGVISVILMILFFKNTMKNVKLAKREIATKFGMRIAITIECIYGFFHYTTFYDILKNKTESLLIKDAQLVSMGMMVIVSGLSVAALIQSRKQAKDDIS